MAQMFDEIPAMSGDSSLTDLIRRAQGGEPDALRSVFQVTYDELKRMARNRLSAASREAVLDTTSLVHECFLRFAEAKRLSVEDRVHFYRYAGQAMRSVIVDLARSSLAARRGGGAVHVPLSTTLGDATSAGEEVIMRVNEALEELGRFGSRLVEVVELRYFAGMTDLEIAQSLGVNERTVRRDWEKARLILARVLEP